MLCVCLSFPITELCLLKRRSDAFLISAFLTDEEQTLTGGHCVFKKNCLTSHSVFTSDTIHRSGRSCSAAFLQHNFFFICIHSPVPFSNVQFPCAQVCYGAMQRKIRLHILFLKRERKRERRNVQSCKNTSQGKDSLEGGCTLILSSADEQNTHTRCTQPVSFKAYRSY